MPAIRDSSHAFETLTTDAGITIPTPNNSTNDLLIAFVMGDTGAPTWTLPSGWTQLFARNNTISTLCAYKISNGSEPTTHTFGATVNETYNGCIISIQDVDTTNPFGNPAVQTNQNSGATAKDAAPSITTTVANSLVLVFNANSGPAAPSFIENKAHSIIAADGSAESMGVGWLFMPSTGSTPTDIYASAYAAAAGVEAAIQIAAPSGGATVIPTYTAADTSTYLDPIHGVTAYNTNTALAATADTNFGTSLGGFTAADATVAAAADSGINSFHSTGQLTTVASATNVYGAELVFAVANRPNATGNNILCHYQVSTPVQLQRMQGVATNKGVWMGMRSGSATNFKIWRVGASDVPNPAGRPIPIVINESAVNTVASAGTLAPSSVLAIGFWVGAKAAGTAAVQFMSLWMMGTTTIGGGNATYPMTIEGIVQAIADGHERKSALLQGSKQMLLLQDLQIGDGGTHGVYLDLDSTAIEFPSQYNATTKQVMYNSVDNKIGITYYAGASDTIKHRNSVISSPSRYKWGLHASSSTSATYDFSGLSVIGAGTVSLARAITITELTINNYSTLDVSNADLVDCTILSPPATNDSVTNNASTSFTGCSINVTTVTSGNRWISVADPSVFVGCTFTGTSSAGHAIRITAPGTYTLDANIFTGFGSTGTNNAAIFNDSGGSVTLNIINGGSTPTYRNGTSASTTVNNTVTVKVTVKDASTFTAIQDSRVLLKADTGGNLPAEESISITRSGSTATVSHTAHGLTTGMTVAITGATQDEYNGMYTVTVSDANTYTYTVSGTPATPATGTPVATAIILHGLSNASGIVQTTGFNYTADQPVTGWARKASTGTKYKQSAIVGTITSGGLDNSTLLVRDE